MRRIKISALKTDEILGNPLYHPNGELIHPPGDKITGAHLFLLQRLGIEEVVELAGEEEIQKFIFFAEHEPVDIESLGEDQELAFNIYDESGKILLKKWQLFDKDRKEDLKRKGHFTVFKPKEINEQSIQKVRNYREAIAALTNYEIDTKNLPLSTSRVKMLQNLKNKLSQEIVESQVDKVNLKVHALGKPLCDFIKDEDSSQPRTEIYKLAHSAVILNTVREINSIFRNVSQGKAVSGETILNVSKEIIKCIIKDKNFLLCLGTDMKNDNYLSHHSVRVAILATAIGTSMGYSPEQVFEIACGAFLHDIGMLKVPRVILEKNRVLNPDERSEIEKHPAYGLTLLQHIQSIPSSAPFITYQVHERIDGTGYPSRRSSTLIHDFAKIVAIADIYDALTSERPYRPAIIPYKAMEEIIFMASKKRVDPFAVKAFLNSTSLFPVGSWVEITDGKKGKVVAANSSDYTRPMVYLVYDDSGRRLEKPLRVDLRRSPELKVKKAVDGKTMEVSISDGF